MKEKLLHFVTSLYMWFGVFDHVNRSLMCGFCSVGAVQVASVCSDLCEVCSTDCSEYW